LFFKTTGKTFKVLFRTKKQTEFRLPLKLSLVATARIAPKICPGQPQQCAHSAPDLIQTGSLSAEL